LPAILFWRKSLVKTAGKLLALGLILLFVFLYTTREKKKEAFEEGTRVTVQRGDFVARATETGSLVPIDAVEIKSEQGGEVKKIFVQAGDLVSVGQPLVKLRPESNQAKRVAEARAMIDSERLNWEEAQRENQRMQSLFEKGFVARRELESASKQAENSGIKYELAKKQLLLTLGGNKTLYKKYLKMDLSTESMEDFILFSPVAGTVIEVNVSNGTIVSSGTVTMNGGTALMRIADISQMWIKTKINEVEISRIRENQQAEIRLDAIPNQVYQGTVVKISPKGETVENVVSYEVILEIKNPDQRFMPSMTANIDIILETEKAALLLPQSALTTWEGGDAVRIPTAEGKTAFRRVTIGAQNETIVVIKKGVKEGETVLLHSKNKTDSEKETERKRG
jgi:HlyD family secretion protein